MLCDQKPTMGPATGVPNHGPRTICLECWEDIYQAPPPQGLALQRRADAITAKSHQMALRLSPVLSSLPKKHADCTLTYRDLRDNIQVRGYKNIETTQTLLCKTCTKDEIARWRLCEADAGYAAAFLADKAQWAADGHKNTFVCVRKYIIEPHYW